jgi:hypothetical protein
MTKIPAGALLLALILACASIPAQASHLAAAVTVEVTGGRGQGQSDMEPPLGGARARPSVKAKAGQALQIRWEMRNTSARTTLKEMVVHFFIVREEKAGQKETPDPRKGAVAENAFATDLAPRATTRGTLKITLDEPGAYLVRVESLYTQQDHEHFSAVDVEVE